MNRVTPEDIKALKACEIFVFGSNESGRHGRGAARQAMKWGAVYGQAEGLMGSTYGIPTKNAAITQTLPIEKIQLYVLTFIEFAKSRPDLTFLVTEIGCGLAGLHPKQVAPLFAGAVAVSNIHLPKRFWEALK